MKVSVYSFLCLICLNIPAFSGEVLAGPGDTITVQVFTYGNSRDSVIEFPSDTIQWEKVYMEYKLKCVPGNNPPCGEWDYLTYTYLYDSTGVLDSNLLDHPDFLVAGTELDSFAYTSSPVYRYSQYEQYELIIDSTISETLSVAGSGSSSINHPFNTSSKSCRTQYIWKASELNSAGVSAGNLDGMRFNVASTGAALDGLKIRFRHTSADGMNSRVLEDDGFTTVYDKNTSFSTTGWNKVNFLNPFNWDGTSNILVDISFTNSNTGSATIVTSDVVGFDASKLICGKDIDLDYEGGDYVEVPTSSFGTIDSSVTVSLWQYGDAVIQPQSDYVFEGRDSAGNRVISSHLPWSNGNVYWDAGNSGGSSYDRIQKAANSADYKGKWNHWAFVKNAKTGEMHIYLNGKLWHSGTAKNRSMKGIATFRIGASALNGSGNYDGRIDEFRVWNIALDSNTIRDWMYSSISGAHPNSSALVAYFDFEEGSGYTSTDPMGGSVASLLGVPAWMPKKGDELYLNPAISNERPQVTFIQGTYSSHIDTTTLTDSTMESPVSLVFFSDSLNPLSATDTQFVWQAGRQAYTYDQTGTIVDSVYVPQDTQIFKNTWYYYSDPFEIVDRYELLRYITPYGIGLDLGDGWMWRYDITDYVPLLTGKKRITAGNWQEQLDLRFVFIEGTPAREAKSVEVLWTGTHNLSTFQTSVPAITVLPDSGASSFKLKSRASGHGFSNPTNCAEFCQKTHYVKVNSQVIDQWKIIIECADNPLYPQGGTWTYDRAGWCPGKEVITRNTELTSFVQPGVSTSIDYDADYDQYGNYRFEGQIISYGPHNFSLDAAVTDIIAPNDWEIHSRQNPICNNPIVRIRNNGTSTLTSLDITYGPMGANSNTYNWTGSLEFEEEEVVELPHFYWGGWTGPNIFEVSILNPNSGTDEYAFNNTYKTSFESTPVYDNKFFLNWRTNGQPNETSWRLLDDQGNTLYQSTPFVGPTSVYADTFDLPDGCYTFLMEDKDDDGLSFFANNDGDGWARFRTMSGQIFKTFEPNFGKEIRQSFTVGYTVGNETEIQYESAVTVYPNPTNGKFTLDIAMPGQMAADYQVLDLTGKMIMQGKINLSSGVYIGELDLRGQAEGMYLLKINTGSQSVSKKVILRN